MNYRLENRDILYNNAQLGPYPNELLKRVDYITTETPGPVEYFSHSDNVKAKVVNGDFGEELARAYKESGEGIYDHIDRFPVSAAITMVRRVSQAAWKKYENPVAKEIAPIPNDPRVLSRHIKSLAHFLGAQQVGICEIPDGACYTDTPDGSAYDKNTYKYAIVLLGHKQEMTTGASSGDDWIFDSCSHQIYLELAIWTEVIENYIHRLGFSAQASNNQNYYTMMTPLILAAGLGEESRLGIAVNPFWGANMKAAAILTNMPLEPDKPIDFGLQDYCEKCRLCVKACPSHCISGGKKRLYHGYMAWPTNFVGCVMRSAEKDNAKITGFTCGKCTKVCPWNSPQSNPEDFKNWDGSIEWLHAKADTRAKYLEEHDYKDEREETNKWWFDLVDWECTSKLEIPATSKFVISKSE